MLDGCRGMRLFIFYVLATVILSGRLFAAEPYQGAIFDAHSHLSKRSNPKQAHSHIIEQGFGKSALFVEINRIDEVLNFSQDKFLVFVDPFKRKKVKVGKGKKEVRYEFSEKRLSQIKSALEAGKVAGFGEIYFRLGYAPFAEDGIQTPVGGSGAKALFKMARTYKVPVQIHLDADYISELEQVLRDNPDVTIILSHCGYMKPSTLGALMDGYPNLHAETSLVFNSMIPRFANLPLKDGVLQPEWENLLIRHADRILLGTDYSDFRAEQVPKLLDYYRKVLGFLPRDKANQIAHENFERLFVK